MFNTIITTVKTLLRRPSTWVWGALFPIVLSTMFMFMFANLSSDGTVDPVPVAVVADEAWDASTFKGVATSLAKEGGDQLLEIHELDDAADANRALKAGEVAGIYAVDDAGTPKLTLLSSYGSSRATSVLTDRSILEAAMAAGRAAEDAGAYYHPAANGEIDRRTGGVSSQIQLVSLQENIRLAASLA